MEDLSAKYTHINGWGIDADPENEPTYPMKEYNGSDHQRLNYDRPQQQPLEVEILKSVERPDPSRVFGTSTPPAGLSGMIRRFAYKYSESTLLRWMPLVLADRVGVFEGYIEDFSKGILPNPFAERGWQAEWKYNRKGMVQNIAIGAAVAAVVIVAVSQKKKANKRNKYSTEGNQLGVNTI